MRLVVPMVTPICRGYQKAHNQAAARDRKKHAAPEQRRSGTRKGIPMGAINQSNIERLAKKLNNDGPRSVIPFVGAGLSIYGHQDDRLPTWRSLLIRLKDAAASLFSDAKKLVAIDALLDAGMLDDAAEIVCKALPSPELRRLMHDTFETASKPLPPAIGSLAKVKWPLIITTNYDSFIEHAWPHGYLPILTGRDIQDIIYLAGGIGWKPHLIKLHGCLDRYDTWVLTASQYNALVVNNQQYETMMKVLLSRSLLFLGYGMADKDFNPLLEQLTTLFPAGIGDHFAVLDDRRKDDPHIKRIIAMGIQPIWYTSQADKQDAPDCGHGAVVTLLDELLKHHSEISLTPPEIYPEYLMGVMSDISSRSLNAKRVLEIGSLFPEYRGRKGRPTAIGVLRALNLVDQSNSPRIAAILCFHDSPQSYVPQACINFSVPMKDGSGYRDFTRIEGALLQQLNRSLESISKDLRFLVDEKNAFNRHCELPVIALRELLVNALIHRDYESSMAISVTLTPEALVISNPGPFACPISRRQMNRVWELARHNPRNPILARVLYHAGIFEGLGSGLARVAKAFRDAGLPLPRIDTIEKETRVTIRRNPKFGMKKDSEIPNKSLQRTRKKAARR